MAYNTTDPLEKLTYGSFVGLQKCNDKFGKFSWFKTDSHYLEVNLKLFKKDDNRHFRLVQNLTVGEADFSPLMQLRNQLVLAAENFCRNENFSPVLIPALSKHIVAQVKSSSQRG